MKRALLIIDVQNEYFSGLLPVTYPGNSIDNIINVIDHANAIDIPVIVIQHTNLAPDAKTFRRNSFEWALHQEIKSRHFNFLIEKNLPGSFTGTDLEQIIRNQNIDTITIAGYMTHLCCDTTARQAIHLGFSVEFLSDATGTISLSNYAGRVDARQLHETILIVQAARFSKVLTAKDWVEGTKSLL